jgi:hypothetical protein
MKVKKENYTIGFTPEQMEKINYIIEDTDKFSKITSVSDANATLNALGGEIIQRIRLAEDNIELRDEMTKFYSIIEGLQTFVAQDLVTDWDLLRIVISGKMALENRGIDFESSLNNPIARYHNGKDVLRESVFDDVGYFRYEKKKFDDKIDVMSKRITTLEKKLLENNIV